MAKQGIICQMCGIEAPSQYVEFHQNIGMLMMRQTSSIRGIMCKRCVHSQFWKKTMMTLGIGWIGTISIVIAPVFIVMNTVRYLMALKMQPVPAGATCPSLNQAAIAALEPHSAELIDRLNARQQLIDVARDIAPRAGVTPGQVMKFVQALAESTRPPAAQKSYGFPVQPANPAPIPQPPPIPVQSL